MLITGTIDVLLIRHLVTTSGHVFAYSLRSRSIGVLLLALGGFVVLLLTAAVVVVGPLAIYPLI